MVRESGLASQLLFLLAPLVVRRKCVNTLSTPTRFYHLLPNIFHVSRDVIFGTGIKIVIRAEIGRLESLKLLAKLPPPVVHVINPFAVEDVPAPLVHQVAERNESNL